MSMEYFCCYHSYKKKCEKLSDQELGRLFRALLEYSESGAVADLTGRESIAFDFIADDIDRSKKAYEEKCAKNAANAQQRQRQQQQPEQKKEANAIERMRTLANANGRSQKENEEKNEEEGKEIKKKTASRFIPPTIEEVRVYCLARGNRIDAERFVDFYTANGWVQGKNKPIKDWKACVRTWEKRDGNKPNGDKPIGDDYSEVYKSK